MGRERDVCRDSERCEDFGALAINVMELRMELNELRDAQMDCSKRGPCRVLDQRVSRIVRLRRLLEEVKLQRDSVVVDFETLRVNAVGMAEWIANEANLAREDFKVAVLAKSTLRRYSRDQETSDD